MNDVQMSNPNCTDRNDTSYTLRFEFPEHGAALSLTFNNNENGELYSIVMSKESERGLIHKLHSHLVSKNIKLDYFVLDTSPNMLFGLLMSDNTNVLRNFPLTPAGYPPLPIVLGVALLNNIPLYMSSTLFGDFLASAKMSGEESHADTTAGRRTIN